VSEILAEQGAEILVDLVSLKFTRPAGRPTTTSSPSSGAGSSPPTGIDHEAGPEIFADPTKLARLRASHPRMKGMMREAGGDAPERNKLWSWKHSSSTLFRKTWPMSVVTIVAHRPPPGALQAQRHPISSVERIQKAQMANDGASNAWTL
jgi:hypothetical protein